MAIGIFAEKWKNTSTVYAIKKFVSNKEVYLTHLADGRQNIIRLHGVTKLDLDKKEYSLPLECAVGGTLRDHLRNNTIDWKNQLRFAKEAVLRLHDDKGIVHGSLWVLFWKLTNHKTPFEGLDDEHITCKILNGVREEPVQTRMLNLLDFIKVKYWEQEPDECLNIFQVNSVLNNIDSENINMLIVPENEKKRDRTLMAN
ncbi:kinase-like domain-containing protein [Rhizophagus clarus]|uniref:Kinase-like domain-containing protein n=1 Tax=Rhizophagus clarus TaxID=94130 RepID=A0A8H3M6K2_9GLOM|nr:kinase-like domain-containing protein [Rhizophagus clarus]